MNPSTFVVINNTRYPSRKHAYVAVTRRVSMKLRPCLLFIYFLFVVVFVIMKTYLYNFHPLKPHFHIVKLGFTRVYIIFPISAQKHRLWVLVTPRRGGSKEYPQSMF